MDERPVQCEFFVPIIRNADKQPHQPTAWILLVNEIRRVFPAGHSGPETFYRGDALVPGEYEDAPGEPPIKDTSRRYLLAIPANKVEDLRQLLQKAANTFDQKAIYLSVKGDVEFIIPSESDGFLGSHRRRRRKGQLIMPTQTRASEPVYQTITGGLIPLPGLTNAEYAFLDIVAKNYNARQDWTRFAAWWNAKFNASGLTTDSVVYRVCQDLEARLGISQGKVSPPDYRDYLAELIDTQFGSRQEFCRATGVDPGQLSRVLANRDNLSMKVLLQVLEVLHARLVIQTEEDSRAQTSIDQAAAAITNAVASHTLPEVSAPETPDAEPEEPISTSTVRQLIDEQLTPLREQIRRLESELHAVGSGK